MGNCQSDPRESTKSTLKVKQTYMVLLPEGAGLKVFPPRLLKSANAFLVTLVYFSGKETQFLSLTQEKTHPRNAMTTLRYKLTRIFIDAFVLARDS